MTLSAWRDVATVRSATCDHVNTTAPGADGQLICSECNTTWPPGSTPATTTVYKQFDLPGKVAAQQDAQAIHLRVNAEGPEGPSAVPTHPGPKVKPESS